MKIKLRLYATLQKYLPPKAATAKQVWSCPKHPPSRRARRTGCAMSLPHIIFINGRHVLRPDFSTRQLQDGDILASSLPSVAVKLNSR